MACSHPWRVCCEFTWTRKSIEGQKSQEEIVVKRSIPMQAILLCCGVSLRLENAIPTQSQSQLYLSQRWSDRLYARSLWCKRGNFRHWVERRRQVKRRRHRFCSTRRRNWASLWTTSSSPRQQVPRWPCFLRIRLASRSALILFMVSLARQPCAIYQNLHHHRRRQTRRWL